MKTDFVVIGSGIAGLNFALEASKYGEVYILTKKDAMESNTNYAQGGIAAVLDKTDSYESHLEDTLRTGCYHNDLKATQYLIKNGPAMIKKLLELGTPFDQRNGVLKLTQEGGHEHRRVAYVNDSTGHSIEKTLLETVKKNKNIKIIEDKLATDLIVENNRCYGVQYLDGKDVKEIYAKAVILAAGGAGQIYKKTTNPAIATGDGIAMAYRAGAKLEDLEFIQFHPTALNKKDAPSFLISEAVRGEGGILINQKGERFMQYYHSKQELAPRDVVARAIANESKKGDVFLDMRHESPEFIKTRFPTIYAKLMEYGIDMTREPVSVLPAAHYLCGGIKVNLDGETSVRNLYAFGENARTGVHGANRLASNSLLESIVFSNNVAEAVENLKNEIEEIPVEKPAYVEFEGSEFKKRIQGLMWNYVGLIRNATGLELAIEELEKIEYSLPKGVSKDLVEIRNMAQVGKEIAKAALAREKSLGCHFREDEEVE